MKVRVDEDRCRGHGMCVSACPKIFAIGEDGYAITLVSEVPAQLHDAARLAVVQCPEGAITVSEP
jgi:ferredoxin